MGAFCNSFDLHWPTICYLDLCFVFFELLLKTCFTVLIQLQAKVSARITGYPLVQACPGKSVVRWTDRPAMTIAVDLGRKATKQTNKTVLTAVFWCSDEYFYNSVIFFTTKKDGSTGRTALESYRPYFEIMGQWHGPTINLKAWIYICSTKVAQGWSDLHL